MHLYPESVREKTGFASLLRFTRSLALTETGAERILGISPSESRLEVRQLLGETAEMMQWQQVEGTFSLSCSLEIPKIIRQARNEGAMLSPAQLLTLLRVLMPARNVRASIVKKHTEYPLLTLLCNEMPVMKELEHRISETVDDYAEVRDSASPELRSIRKRLASKRTELRQRMQQILRQAKNDGMVSDEEATLRNGRMVIPLRAEFKRQFSGFIHDVSGSGQTVYIEPADALYLNNDIREFEAAESAEIERLLKQLTAEIRPQCDALEILVDVVSRLDEVHARARTGHALGGIIPELSDSSRLELWQARNPVLMLREPEARRRDVVIPMDLRLEEEEAVLIITGPNAGGKSVALKTLGLFQLMMQSGFAIPAGEGSKLPVLPGLFVDLGDDQSIENDLSTFSSRLHWMREVLQSAMAGALVLIDEAGAGTDPEEGSALYEAFIDACRKKNVRLVATTHYGQLKVFAHNTPGCVNASMEFDVKTLAPSYVLQKGVPGSSYAFEIGRRMGLPDWFLKDARGRLGKSKAQLEKLILEMEKKTQAANESKVQLDAMQREAARQKTEFEQKNKTLNREKLKIRDRALREARQLLMETNKSVERLVREIKESSADRKTVTKARKELDDQKKVIETELVQQPADPDAEALAIDLEGAPAAGDAIRMKGGSSLGELLEIDGKHATILVNGLKVRTAYKNLIKVQPPKAKTPKITFITTPEVVVRPVSMSKDVRGYRGEAALIEVAHYLDEAARAGLQQVDIVHGKGNGILSKRIHEYLKSRGDVVAFDFAPWDLGGPGCTVVKLK